MSKGKHRKKDRPLIWSFPVWVIAREYPMYARNLYGGYKYEV